MTDRSVLKLEQSSSSNIIGWLKHGTWWNGDHHGSGKQIFFFYLLEVLPYYWPDSWLKELFDSVYRVAWVSWHVTETGLFYREEQRIHQLYFYLSPPALPHSSFLTNVTFLCTVNSQSICLKFWICVLHHWDYNLANFITFHLKTRSYRYTIGYMFLCVSVCMYVYNIPFLSRVVYLLD